MIIFINGPFGVGKTTIAEHLVERLPNSLLFDPEMVGYFLRAIVSPIEKFEDFQDLPMWRPLVVTTARMLKETYGRTLIMPMTIGNIDYFTEVMSGLRQFEPHLFHFCLTATRETILQRLEKRNHSPEGIPWVLECFDRYAENFQLSAFAEQIATDDKTLEEIVAHILTSVTLQR